MKKNKKTKTLISLLLSVVMMIISVFPIYPSAKDNKEKSNNQLIETLNSKISPRYVASCYVYSRHRMTGRGSGFVRNSQGKLILSGFANQCLGCKEVIVSQGNPRYMWNIKGTLGNYTIKNYGENVSNNGVTIYNSSITGYFAGKMSADDYWRGYEFTW